MDKLPGYTKILFIGENYTETPRQNTFYGIGREILLRTKEIEPLIRKESILQNFTTFKKPLEILIQLLVFSFLNTGYLVRVTCKV